MSITKKIIYLISFFLFIIMFKSFEHGKVDDTDSKTDVLVFIEIKYRLN